MVFTYTDPVNNLADWVRLIVKDNLAATAILSDEDLAGIIAAYPDATPQSTARWLAAFDASMALYSHWLLVASSQVGPLRIEGTKRAEEARQRAAMFWNLGHGLSPGDASGAKQTRAGARTLVPHNLSDPIEPLFSRTTPP